jgi:hypothetical protein
MECRKASSLDGKRKRIQRIEMCIKESSVSSDLDDCLSVHRASCKQKYVYRELVTVDNGIVKKNTFRFPSSCCCHREFIR